MATHVTTQGATTYTVTPLVSQHPVYPSRRTASGAPPGVHSGTPPRVPPRVPPPSMPVCGVRAADLDPRLFSSYECLRDETGNYRYVQQLDGHCEASYYNAKLRRSVPLGRFADACVASLAHAVARHPSTVDFVRVTPYAMQTHIDALAAERAEASAHNEAPSMPAHAAVAADDDDGIDLDRLLSHVWDED